MVLIIILLFLNIGIKILNLPDKIFIFCKKTQTSYKEFQKIVKIIRY